jgi:hypothetical protein
MSLPIIGIEYSKIRKSIQTDCKMTYLIHVANKGEPSQKEGLQSKNIQVCLYPHTTPNRTKNERQR